MTHELAWRSRFVYGTGGDVSAWETLLPVRPWTRPTRTVGGSRVAAGGIPAAYVVRRDYLLNLRLRLFEVELDELQALVTWGQNAETILWYPDADDLATSYTVYLEEPGAGGSWEESLTDGLERIVEVELVLRLVAGGPWAPLYFGEESS